MENITLVELKKIVSQNRDFIKQQTGITKFPTKKQELWDLLVRSNVEIPINKKKNVVIKPVAKSGGRRKSVARSRGRKKAILKKVKPIIQPKSPVRSPPKSPVRSPPKSPVKVSCPKQECPKHTCPKHSSPKKDCPKCQDCPKQAPCPLPRDCPTCQECPEKICPTCQECPKCQDCPEKVCPTCQECPEKTCPNFWDESPDEIAKQFCNKYKNHKLCTKKTKIPPPPTTQAPEPPEFGLITNNKGQAVAIMSPEGRQEKLRSPLTKSQTKLAEMGGVPIIENISSEDVKPQSPVITKQHENNLLAEIQAGKKRAKERAKRLLTAKESDANCNIGMRWDPFNKKCVMIAKEEGGLQNVLAGALAGRRGAIGNTPGQTPSQTPADDWE
jgi:hypothetical protein